MIQVAREKHLFTCSDALLLPSLKKKRVTEAYVSCALLYVVLEGIARVLQPLCSRSDELWWVASLHLYCGFRI